MTVWNSHIDTDTEDDEANDSQNLDDREDKLGFTITPDSEKVYGDDENEEQRNPHTRIDIPSAFPIAESDGSSDNFERKGDQPVQGVTKGLARDLEMMNETHFQPIAKPQAGSMNRVP